MRNCILSFFAIFCFVNSGCIDDQKKLKGHWHLTEAPFNIKEISAIRPFLAAPYNSILDNFDDGGYLNQGVNGYGGIPCYFDTESKKLIVGAECIHEEFLYLIEHDTLLLLDSINHVKYVGIQCGEGCCNKQEDYFCSVRLKIDLPVLDDTTVYIRKFDLGKPEGRIFLGRPKKNHALDYFPSDRILLDEDFAGLSDICFWMENLRQTFPHNLRDSIQFSIYASKNVSKKSVWLVLKELKKCGLTEAVLAARAETDLAKEFDLRFLKLSTNYQVEDSSGFIGFAFPEEQEELEYWLNQEY